MTCGAPPRATRCSHRRQVQVSGGQANIAPRVRDTDANGPGASASTPRASVNYVVSAAQAGYGAGSVLATVNLNQTTPLTMFLVPSATPGRSA